ncbi:hypothetical protein Acr_00g0020150 [Actinidia rufa]|uniref:Uncharacterized protein n=1 Tax=Actinidia rufa TaxID=165716 RepID=A0A7J0DDQ9_9ERIC|nr:hypothetical protein Acr_00g0020150 [Actinidia rufa]
MMTMDFLRSPNMGLYPRWIQWKLRQDAKGLSTSFNGSSSLESFGLSDKEVDKEATSEVRVEEEDVEILIAEPILALSSAFETANDLSFPIVAPAAEDLIEHSFNQSGGAGTSLEEVDMSLKPRPLGKEKTAVVSPAKQARDPILALPSPAEGQPSMPSYPYISKRKGKLLSYGYPKYF